MSDHLHIEKGVAPGKEILLAYLRGELNTADKKRVEEMIAADPFLADAMEGLKEVNPQKMEAALNAIYLKVDAITRARKPFSISKNFRTYSIAASLLIFAGISIFVIMQLNRSPLSNSESSIAKNEMSEGSNSELKLNVPDSGMGAGPATDSIQLQDAEPVRKSNAVIFNNDFTLDAYKSEESTASVTIESITLESAQQDSISVSGELALEQPVINRVEEKDLEEQQLADAVPLSKTAVPEIQNEENGNNNINRDDAYENAGAVEKSEGDKKLFNKREKSGNLEPAVSESAKSDTIDVVYSFVGQMPSFPGGMDSLNAFIANNLQYPESILEGKVSVKFIVHKDGSISNAVVVKKLAPSFDNEALRLVSLMPKWNPGIVNGKPVDVYYTMLVKFSRGK